MKVVLFCGGLGMRLREFSDSIPKPMVNIGYRPILWHVMKYYAHFGHKDFILCLGYKADMVKNYFLNYNECVSNDFVLSEGGRNLELLHSDIHDWKITFVDTGIHANIGQRLRTVRHHLKNEEMFLANYADGLTDLPLPAYIQFFSRRKAVASFVSVRSGLSYHLVTARKDGVVTRVESMTNSGNRVNAGYFLLRQEIFSHLREGDELVVEPFQRLIRQGKLLAYEHNGYWACMDTFKEKQTLEDLYATGHAPWEVWKAPASKATRRT